MRVIAALILLVGLFLVAATAAAEEYYFEFKIDSPGELKSLTRIISIDNVRDGVVRAYANEEQWRVFQSQGYEFTLLPNPGTLYEPRMADTPDKAKDWDTYPTYPAYVAMMNQFAADYPDLCVIENIGTTVNGRALLFARISDNVNTEEDEPEVMFTSTMHGDETVGYILMLRLIDYYLSNYGTDSLATRMVDSCEIWINPNANPDGTYYGGDYTVSGARRVNGNSIDINRNFPDPEDGAHPDGHSWQPETVAMMDFADAHSFVISANLHSGAEVINYPWDTWPQLHADDSWYIDISRAYADSAHYYSPSGYLTFMNDGITNGYQWYTISGGRQDYMNYWHGCREVTFELSNTKLLPENELDAHWTYNKASLLDWLENGLYGVRGLITGSDNGLPLDATVTVLDHDHTNSEVFTDPDVGDYHRMLEAGTYTLIYSAGSYLPDTAFNVVVDEFDCVRIDIDLDPIPSGPMLTFQSHDGGKIEPGDDVSMHITLGNYGAANANNPGGLLGSADSYITITQNNSTYPTIASLGSGTSYSTYELSVSAACPRNYLAEFWLNVSADGGAYTDSLPFSLVIGPPVENFETGDFTLFDWTMLGNQGWDIVTSNVYEGTYSARSGNISDNQSSIMQVLLETVENGSLSFYYRVSSEEDYDYLYFYIDGAPQDSWSGTVGWTQATYSVSPGTHTFRWEYKKDNSWSSGSDCAWVDLIEFPAIESVLRISSAGLPDWTVGQAYSEQLAAEGGTGSYDWSDANDGLTGTGLSLSTAGLVSGTPTGTGPVSFLAEVSDGTDTDQKTFGFTINAVPDIATTTLPAWTVDQPYSQVLTAIDGTGTGTWTDKNGDLTGTGLILGSTGNLSGTPTVTGNIDFTARVTDIAEAFDEQPLTVTVNPAVSITTTILPDGVKDNIYSYQLACAGGTGTMTWSDKNGDLDGSGMSLTTDGVLSGTPTQDGLISFIARVTDVPGSTDEQELSLKVNLDFICGDVTDDGLVNILDISFLINYKYKDGPPPEPMVSGDANSDETINLLDIIYLINFKYKEGPAPQC